MAFILGQFHERCLSHQSLKLVLKITYLKFRSNLPGANELTRANVQFILYIQYYSCWCPGDARRQQAAMVLTSFSQNILGSNSSGWLQEVPGYYIWVRSRNCGRLVTWFCYQLIAKPGNKTAAVSWPDPYRTTINFRRCKYMLVGSAAADAVVPNH